MSTTSNALRVPPILSVMNLRNLFSKWHSFLCNKR